MTRLPKVGSDSGTWGKILNDFLEVEHNSDGTQKTLPLTKGGTGATDAATALSNLGGETPAGAQSKADAAQANAEAASLPLTYLDTDSTLAANSDIKIPSQKAVKTAIANVGSLTASGDITLTPGTGGSGSVTIKSPALAATQLKLKTNDGTTDWATFAQGRVFYYDPRGGSHQPETHFVGDYVTSDATKGSWGIGIDSAAADEPGNDFFIGRDYAGGVRDVIYVSQRGTQPTDIGVGFGNSAPRITSDQRTATVSISPYSDAPSTKGVLLLRSGTAQAVTTPVLSILYQNGSNSLLKLTPDGAIVSADNTNTLAWQSQVTGGTGRMYISGRLGIGTGSSIGASSVLEVKTASGTDSSINVTTGAGNGNLELRAQDGSANIYIQTLNNSSLTFRQNSTQALKITTGKSVLVGVTNITTTSTDGFPYIPAAAGAPGGTPATNAGFAPIYYDTTNHKLWIYDGGWKGVVVS